MLLTPGPLLIVPNDRGDAIWLRDPARVAGNAVASVWRTPDGAAEGNAKVMAYAGALYDLARRVASISGKADGAEVIAMARALLTEMEGEGS